ncbi:hypothetical protein GCM10009560_53480 [Nonomuraea longicatena]|uniref:Lipoprotein n=2 Tax=Nonomuraea longicatena TaxID=83682 RepID=A0ABP4AVI7_9ACTN
MMTCALALVTLTACTSGPTGGEPVARGVIGADGATPPPASQSPAALTPAAYKDALASRQKTMSGALKSMLGARTVTALDTRLERAGESLRGAADALAELSPPPEVKSEHDTYVVSLRELANSMGSTSGKVGSRAVCTPGAVLTDLGAVLKRADQAGQALESAGGYPADFIDAGAASKKSRRLSNGHFLRKESLTGRSYLQVDNGSPRDAVITVVRGGKKAVTVYVRKKTKFKIRGVRDGSYKIFFTHGVDWDGKRRAFSRDCSFERFEKSVRFRTVYTATQIRWHDWKITLHAISGGNAPTKRVDPDSFPS